MPRRRMRVLFGADGSISICVVQGVIDELEQKHAVLSAEQQQFDSTVASEVTATSALDSTVSSEAGRLPGLLLSIGRLQLASNDLLDAAVWQKEGRPIRSVEGSTKNQSGCNDFRCEKCNMQSCSRVVM